MKIAITFLCLAACFSTPMAAQEAGKKPDLVTTAKQSKEKRKKSSTRVITNKDVKKSKGKLIVLSTPVGKPAAEAAKQPLDPDKLFRERRDASERLQTAQKKVDGLQKELDSIEQQYYRENDPNYRDQVIQQRFAQTKRQFDDARQELADARDALKKFDPSQK
ncbi:MAG TPA: hypothetical protein VGS96_12845 [Thermoanaerobaculia bacterium]|jgi:hypothetical protein|nr:hypothetical protein [Thermoanaerobaculia bacterium]